MKSVDDLNLEIIRRLWDGRTPFSHIAKELGVTENTVRSRVNRLVESGVLQIIGLVNPDAIPGHGSAVVRLKTELYLMRQIAREVRGLKGVVGCACTTGQYNIHSVIMTNDRFTIKDFLEDELTQVKGILSVDTAIALGGDGYNLRYVL